MLKIDTLSFNDCVNIYTKIINLIDDFDKVKILTYLLKNNLSNADIKYLKQSEIFELKNYYNIKNQNR